MPQEKELSTHQQPVVARHRPEAGEITIPLRLDVTESELECVIECLTTHPKNTDRHVTDRRSLLRKITAALHVQADAPPA
jgi:hypothetical protein